MTQKSWNNKPQSICVSSDVVWNLFSTAVHFDLEEMHNSVKIFKCCKWVIFV